jgi:hypothetical protein
MTIKIYVNGKELLFDNVIRLVIDDASGVAEFQFGFWIVKFPFKSYENYQNAFFEFEVESELGIQQGVVPLPVLVVQGVQNQIIKH